MVTWEWNTSEIKNKIKIILYYIIEVKLFPIAFISFHCPSFSNWDFQDSKGGFLSSAFK